MRVADPGSYVCKAAIDVGPLAGVLEAESDFTVLERPQTRRRPGY